MVDLMVPAGIITRTLNTALASHRERASKWSAEDVRVLDRDVTPELLAELEALAQGSEDYEHQKFGRVVTALIAAGQGDYSTIPSIGAAAPILEAYLRDGMIDGWLYRKGADGYMHPWLVTRIEYDPGRPREGEPQVSISLTADRAFVERGQRRSDVDQNAVVASTRITLRKGDVARKKPDAVIRAAGWTRETPELKAAYEERFARYSEIMNNGFAQQFRFTGMPESVRRSWEQENARENRKVVMDVARNELLPLRGEALSVLHGDSNESDGEPGYGPTPVVTQTRVFDLKSQVFWNVNVNDLTDYVYDDSLRDKLILPPDQRELLDVLTTDLSAFTADIVEGKSAGNVVLAKGRPGVGKTLTAEVYAEIVHRPLYAIHSGTLGTTPESVRKALETSFELAQRWNAVMLLDEADVFVLERGHNIEQNAVTAEFLRTLEYFDGLLFMTTNRSDNIDDAIISRCAALIDYATPTPADARRIWKVLATQMKAELPESLLDELVAGLPDASPRDMKMLLRLALRMAAARGEALNAPLFARCAMFRGLHFTRTEA